ncbi:MAG: hypothetical protein K5886_05020 [Lachnospiraceae bacterium]|nr:hypothetical protein [Lachnospiraceae bacterium]
MQTIKLYDEEPYGREFDAVVTEVRELSDGLHAIILDRTLFFPEEGGQSSDTGSINGYEVLHVTAGILEHSVRCSGDTFRVGDRVHGEINWEHRFSNMQNHTGEHILSGLLHSGWHSENTGFHLSDNIVTVDTEKELTQEDIKRLEYEANRVVYRNLPVTCVYYEPSKLDGMEYRSKKEFESQVRIVTIPGVDVCACCAPHVKNTGEVGIIKIIGAIRHKGGMRFTILCGERAYKYLSRLKEISDELTGLLSAGNDAMIPAVKRLLEENEALKIKIKNGEAQRLKEDIKAIPEDSENAILFTGEIDNLVQRNAVNELARKHRGICAVFAAAGSKKADEPESYKYICSWPGGDAGEAAAFLKKEFNAKGGGSKEMVQGTVTAGKEQILKSLEVFHSTKK